MMATLPRRTNPFAIAASRLDPDSERFKADREREEALSDVRRFARHVHIQDPVGREVGFADVGWAWQFVLLAVWVKTKLGVVLKARQLGVSWLAAIFALWTAMRAPGQVVLLISKKQDDANKLLEKVAYIHHRLPDWKPRAIIRTESISFPTLGSEIEALAATEDAGRSRTANLVVLDEHGFQPFATKILGSVMGAAEQGKVLSISTGNGRGALHSRTFLRAKGRTPLASMADDDGRTIRLQVSRGLGDGWLAMFIPYDAHPERDASWWAHTRATQADLSDAEFVAEYPRNDIEAIRSTGSAIFDADLLDAMPVTAGGPVPGVPGATMYQAPQVGARYVIGADPAEGNADSDWSSASVLRISQEVDGHAGEQVAVLRGRWAPEVFARKLHDLAQFYGQHASRAIRHPVLLAWERNNHGHAVRVALEAIWRTERTMRYGPYVAKDRKAGWLQTRESRAVLVDGIAAAVRTGSIVLRDGETVEQFAMFHENEKGRAEAQDGYHDDDVIAVGLAWAMRRLLWGQVVGRPAPKAAAA